MSFAINLLCRELIALHEGNLVGPCDIFIIQVIFHMQLSTIMQYYTATMKAEYKSNIELRKYSHTSAT